MKLGVRELAISPTQYTTDPSVAVKRQPSRFIRMLATGAEK